MCVKILEKNYFYLENNWRILVNSIKTLKYFLFQKIRNARSMMINGYFCTFIYKKVEYFIIHHQYNSRNIRFLLIF